jgi:hypothetical protein
MTKSSTLDLTSPAPSYNTSEDSANQGFRAGHLWALICVIIAGWAASVASFGLPGLYIPAVCAVPVVYTFLLIITRG